MLFRIENFNPKNIKAPCKNAKFKGFDDSNTKIYEIELNTLEDLMKLIKEVKTDISIFPSYKDDVLPTIEVHDCVEHIF